MEEAAFYSDDDWKRAQAVLEAQAKRASERLAKQREAALLGIQVETLEHMYALDQHPAIPKFCVIGYVEHGSGKITRPLGHDKCSFMHVYQYSRGARFAVVKELDGEPGKWEFMLVNLWNTPSAYYTEAGGKSTRYDEPLLLDKNVMRFPHEDAAMAAAVIKAHHPAT